MNLSVMVPTKTLLKLASNRNTHEHAWFIITNTAELILTVTLCLFVHHFCFKKRAVELFRASLLEAVSALQDISADLLFKTVIILGQTLLKLHAGINGTGKGEKGLLSCSHSLLLK